MRLKCKILNIVTTLTTNMCITCHHILFSLYSCCPQFYGIPYNSSNHKWQIPYQTAEVQSFIKWHSPVYSSIDFVASMELSLCLNWWTNVQLDLQMSILPPNASLLSLFSKYHCALMNFIREHCLRTLLRNEVTQTT